MDAKKSSNYHSISILFVYEGTNKKYNPDDALGNENTTTWYTYTPEQIASFIQLAQQLKTAYNIADKDIVGYSKVCTDKDRTLSIGESVGSLFPWRQANQNTVRQ